jgi:flagellar assembly protein FliH
MAASIQKYLFTTSFDELDEDEKAALPQMGAGSGEFELDGEAAPAPAPEPEPEPPPPPTFSEEEMLAAREQSFAEGREQGAREAEQTAERVAADALAAMDARLKAMEAAQREGQELAVRRAVQVAMAIARKLLPELARRNGMAEIEAVVAECMAQRLDEPRLLVKVNEMMLEPLRERLARLAETSGFGGRLVVSGDSKVVPGDCRIEWADGGADRDQARLWKEIEAIIERSLGKPEEPAADIVEDEAPVV